MIYRIQIQDKNQDASYFNSTPQKKKEKKSWICLDLLDMEK